jgi:hypothetical protein
MSAGCPRCTLDPANANRYAYAACDPINLFDPLGLLTENCAWSLVGFGVGLVGLVASAGSIPVTRPVGVSATIALSAAISGSAIGGVFVVTGCP